MFTAGSVTSNTVVTLSVPVYDPSSGFTLTLSKDVTIVNVLPSFTAINLLTNGGLVLTLNGIPGRTNIIEAATNLAPPATVWVRLATNTVGGVWNFTNSSRSNFNRRFFRARQLPSYACSQKRKRSRTA